MVPTRRIGLTNLTSLLIWPASNGAALADKTSWDKLYRDFRDSSHFPLLDGLRCLSIVAVVWFHAVGKTFSPIILSRGNFGVSLFFVISGFLITTLLLRERSKTGNISLGRFYVRRSLRIFPLYYGMLVVYVVLVAAIERGSEPGHQFWQNLPYFATYTSNWFVPLNSDRVIFFFAWSLAVEEQFYLFWPWVLKLNGGLLLAATVAGTLIVMNWLISALYGISAEICLGAIAAILLHHPRSFGWVRACLGWSGSPLVAFAGMLLALAFDGTPAIAIGVAMTWLVIACVLQPGDWLLGQLLTNRFVVHVGTVSYGIYLLHLLCINLVKRGLDLESGPLLFLLALPVSVATATVSYRFFETPFLRLKDRIAKRP
jgi:peptidoglycan/LPS O-acetylase OafA/YrhL